VPPASVVAITAIVLFAAGLLVPASDLASNDRANATSATGAPAPVVKTDPYITARKHGTPVALLRRPTALRAAPNARGARLASLRRRTEWHSPRVFPVVGRRGGWVRVIATELRNGKRGWIRLADTKLLANPWSIGVDLSARRVTVRRHGRVVRSFPVAIGRPGNETPTGSFAVTDKLHLTGGNSAAYGCCALALSGHQPKIAQGWTGGDRLAIHATRLIGTIGTAASLGCLRARDEDARYVLKHAWLGTVVRIRR
jgi:hypothetical protein